MVAAAERGVVFVDMIDLGERLDEVGLGVLSC